MKYVISRPINGITINGKEYVCDDNGICIAFETEQKAVQFLLDHGLSRKEIKFLDIDPVEEGNDDND